MTISKLQFPTSSGVLFNGESDYGTVYLPNEPVRFASMPPPKEVIIETPQTFSEIKNNNYVGLPLSQNTVFQSVPINTFLSSAIPVKTSRFSVRPILTMVSTGFMALSLFGLLVLFWPVIVQELRYNLILSHETKATTTNLLAGFPNGDGLTPSNTVFSIIVPKIDAKAPVIANVDTSDEKIYMNALKTGVAHAKGTCFPGMDCRMYLFAHSTNSLFNVSRYNAVFYLLSKLERTDQIIVYYYGKKYVYEVTGKQIVSAGDTQYITQKGESEELILQTCDPPGTSINRLLVFAKPRLVEYLQ